MSNRIFSIVFCSVPFLIIFQARAETSDAELSAYHHRLKEVRAKPYIDVLRTPEGRNILRDGPPDHIHHHGLMFAIMVDGVNFWEEPNDGTHGVQIPVPGSYQKRFDEAGTGEKRNTEEIELDWIIGDRILLKEKRTIQVELLEKNIRLLTWKSRLSLPHGKMQAVLGGNHYHGLGMRFDQSMDRNGQFFSSQTGKPESIRGDEMLTPCTWMAYTASLGGRPVTVAMFDSPENPRPMLAFTMGQAGRSFAYLAATVNLYRKPMTLKQGENVKFCYRVAIWDNVETQQDMERLYRRWNEKRQK